MASNMYPPFGQEAASSDTNAYMAGYDGVFAASVGGGGADAVKKERFTADNFQLSGGRQWMIRARGLPWSVTDDEIAEFFEPEIVMTTKEQIHRYDFNGRFSGEIFIELYTPEEVQSAVRKNRKLMGKRYIEVFESSEDDYQKALEKAGLADAGIGGEPILKLRGLPFHVKEDELRSFLDGCEVKRDGIHFVPDRHGRGTCNGEAFVELVDGKTLDRALSKNKATIGTRWIEVFKSTRGEMESIMYPDAAMPAYDPYYGGYGGEMYAEDVPFTPGSRRPFRPGPYDRHPPPPHHLAGPPPGAFAPPPSYGRSFRMKMKGLPFESTRQDVVQFFHPAEVLFLEFVRDSSGKVQEGMVEFGNERDFQLALSRHKEHMGRRYVELIPCEEEFYPPGGYGAPRGPPVQHGLFQVKMRGLPFECSTSEIHRFFEGLNVTAVEMIRDSAGKVQEAFASFNTESEFNSAMERNKQNIRHRYIELFNANDGSGGPLRRGGARGFPRKGGFGGRGGAGYAAGDGSGRAFDYGGFN